jgi:putative ABC transport system permease protein
MTWGADWRAEARKTFEQVYLALYAILVVFAIPALLGMINTLAINILERTREIGVLRAIGTTRRQVQRLVLAESVLLGAAGAGLGMLAGLALGYGFTTLTAGAFGNTITYSFPLAGLIAAFAVALLLGVLASWVPARQAARLRIVQALQYE